MIIIETCPKCGHDLMDEVICTYPPIPAKRCPSCGWYWEGKQEQIIRVPFSGNAINTTEAQLLNDYLNYSYQNSLDNLIVDDLVNDFKPYNTDTLTFNELSKTLIRNAFSNDACKNCPNNPENGGTGICFCTLGQPEIR